MAHTPTFAPKFPAFGRSGISTFGYIPFLGATIGSKKPVKVGLRPSKGCAGSGDAEVLVFSKLRDPHPRSSIPEHTPADSRHYVIQQVDIEPRRMGEWDRLEAGALPPVTVPPAASEPPAFFAPRDGVQAPQVRLIQHPFFPPKLTIPVYKYLPPRLVFTSRFARCPPTQLFSTNVALQHDFNYESTKKSCVNVWLFTCQPVTCLRV